MLGILGGAVIVYFVLRSIGGPTWPPLDNRWVYTSYEGCRYTEKNGQRYISVDPGDEIEGPDGGSWGLLSTEKWRCEEYDEPY